jgi:nicotinate-nucleotide adenylyltransferase
MRIGVFGGTFNPIHNGHVLLAKGCADRLGLERVYVIPALLPPHKAPGPLPEPEHRLNLCALAFGEDGRFAVSDMEIKRGGVSYTVDTLRELKTLYPEDRLYLILGGDMFLQLPKWRDPREIFALASVAAAPRRTEELEAMRRAADSLQNQGADIHLYEQLPLPLSSTQLREGEMPMEEGMPAACLDYIRQNGLYGCKEQDYRWPFEKYIEAVRRRLSDRRFHHSMMVARQAKELALCYGENADAAYVAGIVHDILKETDSDRLLQILGDSAIMQKSSLEKHPKILHGFAAAEYIRRELLIYNTRIINAVRFHSTGLFGRSCFGGQGLSGGGLHAPPLL